MKIQPGVWGIDLGQCGLKALRLQEIEGQLTATAFDYVEHPKILSQPDADPDQLTREALEKFLSRNTLRGDTVAISVPGQSGLARFVKLPPVEEKKITDIVKFEAKQQIPFNLDEVVWDFQKIGVGMVTDGFAMDTEIGLFAMKRDMVNRYLQHFKDVNVEVHVIQMAPLALCNFAAYDLLNKGAREEPAPAAEGAEGTEGGEEGGGHGNCVVILDIGADSSNLVITDGERIIWQRPIPLGGNHFTRALTKDLKLTFAKAEHLKRNATKSPDLKKILSALKPVLNDFVGEVQRSLGYFTNTHRDAQIEYMLGLGNAFRLPGLQRFLEEKLSLTVKKLTKMERLTGDTVLTAQVYTENIMTFAVAYGLAVQGLQRTRLLTNLLPAEIRTERLIRAKKPWAAASAAALLLGLGGMAAGYGMSYRSYTTKEVKDAIAKVQNVQKKAQGAESAFTAAKATAVKEEESVKSIVAGQGEYINWLEMMAFLSSTIPQPDGSNLPKRNAQGDRYNARAEYFDNQPSKGGMTGKQAFEEFKKRMEGLKGKTSIEAINPKTGKVETVEVGDDATTGLGDLIQVDVEAVDNRWCDDLPGFWNVLRRMVPNKGDICPLVQADKAPEGKGWVFEIRGHTFHRGRHGFVMDTFVKNIFDKGIPDFKKDEGPATPPPVGGAPAVKGKPGGPPPVAAAPGGAPGGAAAPGGAPGGAAPSGLPDKGPVLNRISHVVLYKTTDKGPGEAPSAVAQLVSDATAPVGGPPGAMGMPASGQPASAPTASSSGSPGGAMGVPSAPTRDSWTPLGTGDSGQATSRSGAYPAGMQPRHNASAGTGADTTGTPNGLTRTDFVILFVWKEPTSLDNLLGQDAGAGAPGGLPPVGGALPSGMRR